MTKILLIILTIFLYTESVAGLRVVDDFSSCLMESDSSFSKAEIHKMHELKVRVSLDGNGYQKDQIVLNSMVPEKLIKAKLLDLSNIDISIIPSWLSRFTNIRYLDLSNTNITISELNKLFSCGNFDKLDVLKLSENKLFKKGGSIKDINNFPNVAELDLSFTNGKYKNYLGLENIKDIETLNLKGNNISNGINNLNLRKLPNLKNLDISYNKIVHLSLSKLPLDSLVKLYLNNNKIEYMEAKVMKYIDTIDLSNNPKFIDGRFCGAFVLPNLSVIKGINLKKICKDKSSYNKPAIKEGLKQNEKLILIQVTKDLLVGGFNLDAISGITNLSIEEIERIRKEEK
jgi:Leucine-rich repeat (LRR) protein